ncbi:MAG TPA: hypothetical protein VJA21_02135 [Verrucomicrobiae bacterium]
MTAIPRDISVTAPLGQAFERVKTVLFQPFDLGRWFIIGFCAWLAYLGEGGGFHGGGNWGSGHGHGGQGLRQELDHAREFVMNNLGWILPLAIGIVFVGLVIWLVVLWLSSRGRFMFLHCVALNTAEVQKPWHKFAREANSLFLCRLGLALAGMLLALPLIAGMIILIMRMVLRESATAGGVLGAIGFFLALLVVSAAFWVVGRLLRDFVTPIQFLRGTNCLAAWREFRELLPGYVGHFFLYLLFRIVLAIGIGLFVLLLVLATCCLAGCLMLLPYIGTVLLLPVLVLERSYSLYFLAQFGPSYDVFQVPAMTP